MFNQKLEKGLFTFYWEESNNQNKMNQTYQSKSKIQSEAKFLKRYQSIEESQIRRRQNFVPKSLLKKIPYHINMEIQSKDVLVPHSVNLSPQIDLPSSPRVKPLRKKIKHLNTLPQMKGLSSNQSISKIQGLQDKLQFIEQDSQFHKQTLVVKQSIQSVRESRTMRTPKVKKFAKGDTTKEEKLEKVNSKKKLPTICVPEQNQSHISNAFPGLFGKHLMKRYKGFKQNFCIDKSIQKKIESSVINIGVSSSDQYKIRWQRRKEEFLQLSRLIAQE